MTRREARLTLLPGLGALLVLLLWPPVTGNLLVVPLFDPDANAVAKAAVAGGALLLGAGPLPGSMIVVGDRARVARHMKAWDMVIVAAPPGGCRVGALGEGETA